MTARDVAFSFPSSLFKLPSPVFSTQPLPRTSPTSFPRLWSPTSPSPCSSYQYEFQSASVFHSVFPAFQSCPAEFDCNFAMYLPCQTSDPCWRQQGIQMIPLIEPTVFKRNLKEVHALPFNLGVFLHIGCSHELLGAPDPKSMKSPATCFPQHPVLLLKALPCTLPKSFPLLKR